MPATTFQTRRLRYPGACAGCGRALTPGDEAQWHPTTKELRCAGCAAAGTGSGAGDADPFAVELRDAGVAGRSVVGYYGRSGDRGAEGERRLGAMLTAGADAVYHPIHDRRMPGSKANIDHLVVAPRGVFVVDAKQWGGKIEWVTKGLKPRLLVGGRDRTAGLAAGLARQAEVVETVLGRAGHDDVPVERVVCFVDGEWPLLQPSFRVTGMLVTSPRPLIRRLVRHGPLTFGRRTTIADLLAVALPPA